MGNQVSRRLLHLQEPRLRLHREDRCESQNCASSPSQQSRDNQGSSLFNGPYVRSCGRGVLVLLQCPMDSVPRLCSHCEAIGLPVDASPPTPASGYKTQTPSFLLRRSLHIPRPSISYHL